MIPRCRKCRRLTSAESRWRSRDRGLEALYCTACLAAGQERIIQAIADARDQPSCAEDYDFEREST